MTEAREPRPAPRQASAPATRSLLGVVLVPVGGVLFGLAAIALGEQGTGSPPLLGVLVLAVAAAAGAAPLRLGLPVAIVLASFGAFLADFAGSGAQYANEAYVGTLALTSAVRRRPARGEVAAVAVVAVVYLGYLAAGSGATEIFWAAKVLLTSAVAGWAIYRLRPERRDWQAAFLGLAFGCAANVVVALWQLHKGVAGLQELGVPYGERVRQTVGESLRAFGGMTSPAPFSYLLAIALLWWLALVLGERDDRRIAVLTAWLPLAAVLGIVWSDDRLAFVGLAVAVVALAARRLRPERALAAAALVPVVVALAIASSPGWSLAERAVKYDSDSARFRRALWHEYAKELSLGGAGPAASGSAYERVADPRGQRPGLKAVRGWLPIQHPHPQVPVQIARERARMLVGEGPRRRRRLTWHSLARSQNGPRTLVASLDGQTLGSWRLSPTSWRDVSFAIPPGRGPARIDLTANPGRPGIALQLVFVDVAGLPAQPLTRAERIYRRVFRKIAATSDTSPAEAGPGVVDDLYLSWLFQYGLIVGAVLSLGFAALLLSPLRTVPGRRPPHVAAALTGVFVVAAALAVNVWEETPTDFLAAVGLALAAAASAPSLPRTRAGKTRPPTVPPEATAGTVGELTGS